MRHALLCTAGLLLSSCTAFDFLGTLGHASVSNDERTFAKQVEDKKIEAILLDELLQNKDIRKHTHVTIVCVNHLVIAIGQAPNPHLKQKIITILKQHKSSSNLIIRDLIRLGPITDLYTRSKDSFITAKIKTQLLNDKDIDASKIKVLTENGEAILLGLVNKKEANKAVSIARSIQGVSKVIHAFEVL